MSDGTVPSMPPPSDSEDDDDMTPAEREQWLRDRGVLIETSVDRRIIKDETGMAKAKDIDICGSGGASGGPPSIVESIRRLSTRDVNVEDDDGKEVVEEGIKFVYIPRDETRPISTLILPRRLIDVLGPNGDVLPTYVKSHFADGKSIDVDLFEEHAKGRHHTILGGDGGRLDNIRSSNLADATSGGSVETFPLVRPSNTNRNTGVYIYLDEVGLLKKLSSNRRASTLAYKCGYHPSPNFYGDVFVGRACAVPFLHNVDMCAEDVLDTSREWMVRAPMENVAYQKAINEYTGREGELQPDVAGTEGVAVHVDGGVADGGEYSWLQNEEEVEIAIPMKDRAVGGKANKSSIGVAFRSREISVTYDGKTMLELKLYSRLDVDGCTWTLDGDGLVITCEKASGGEIWPRLGV